MDFPGAIEAFEQSLEANPHSAAAHFELGWLYDEKASDPAAAIFHYQRYLKLNPNADNADVIKQRIYRCKQQLAADVLPLPSAPAAQQQPGKTLRAKPAIAGRSRQMAHVLCRSAWRRPKPMRPNAGLQHAGAGCKSNVRSAGAKYFRRAGRCQPGPSRKCKASRRQAAHTYGRRGRNGNGHHAQIRREARRVAGSEPGREPEPDSHRPGPEPSVAVIDPHDSASHISFHHGILGRDERAV